MDVSDSASNRRDQIANFAEILKNAKARQMVFTAVYFGKKKVKTVADIAGTTKYSTKRVTEIAKHLVHEKLFEQGRMKIKGVTHTVYKKIPFVGTNKAKILGLAQSSNKLDKYQTKTNPRFGARTTQTVVIKVPYKIETEYVDAGDFLEFSKIATAKSDASFAPERLPEVQMKTGIIKLLGEAHVPKDWGGENDDIFSTNITLKNKKRRVAFALKGPAKSGPLVPAKMGKNGDQIQRLFSAPAEVFILQYEGEVKESVFTLMEELAKAKAVSSGKVYWCVIDDKTTKLLRSAYPSEFK